MSVQSREWILAGSGGLEDLKIQIASTPPLGPLDVLVSMKAVSLNNRDVVLALVCSPTLYNEARILMDLSGRLSLTMGQRCSGWLRWRW